MKLGELYNQNEAKKRRIMKNVVENFPKWAKGAVKATSLPRIHADEHG